MKPQIAAILSHQIYIVHDDATTLSQLTHNKSLTTTQIKHQTNKVFCQLRHLKTLIDYIDGTEAAPHDPNPS